MSRYLPLGCLFALCLVLGLSGCASLGSGSTEQMLSAAGFQSRTPTTARQQQLFSSLTPYQVQQRTIKGKTLYTYADPKLNLLFIGGPAEYQAYSRLAVQEQISQNNFTAAEMNQTAAEMNETASMNWTMADMDPLNIWW